MMSIKSELSLYPQNCMMLITLENHLWCHTQMASYNREKYILKTHYIKDRVTNHESCRAFQHE